jgi:RNA polymerase sigma-70 factor, ECF subfamily
MENENQKDLEAIDRVFNGRREAFEDIIKKYSSRICSVCYGIIHNYEDARDLSQEIFIKVFDNLNRFNRQSSFYTWLYRIAVNMAIDHQRKFGKIRKMEAPDLYPAEDTRKPGQGPRDSLKRKEMGLMIRKAIDELPEDQKKVIVLRELNDMPYGEIAKVMSCSEGTVMSRLHYARKKLQEKLKGYWDEQQD